MLYPHPQQPGSRNDLSCVLKISSAYGAILLTGDIERYAEIGLVRHYREQIAADILVAPHHGSRTSSTQTFIHYVSPQYVLFPSGYQNRFNFPASDVVARYHALGSQTFETGKSGALTIKLDPQQDLTPNGWRQQQRRLWQRNATE